MLLTVMWLITKHADCRIALKIANTFIRKYYFSKRIRKSVLLISLLNLYAKSVAPQGGGPCSLAP